MSNIHDLMAPVTIQAFRLDCTPIELTADAFHADRLKLAGATVDEFVDGNGSPVMMMYKDGDGKEYRSDNDNYGVSLPGLVFQRKHMVTYKTSNLADVRMGNFTTRKQLNT